MKKLIITMLLLILSSAVDPLDQPVVTAEKYIAYKRANGHLSHFVAPRVVFVCYQYNLFEFLLKQNPDAKPSENFSDLSILADGKIGILGGWGIGAPALANKMEQLIALGVKKFVAVGTCGTLLDSHVIGDFVLSIEALADDGVAHLYLPEGVQFAKADQKMVALWKEFASKQTGIAFHTVPTWSFSAIFRETPRAIKRAKLLGCGVVEMEAATLYAIGQDKGVETFSLFVVSDRVSEAGWVPRIKEPLVRDNLQKAATLVFQFCKTL